MRSPRRVMAPLGALFVLSLPLVLSACGGDNVPSNSVAQIGGDTIHKSTFDHWLKLVAIQSAAQSGGNAQTVKVPDAPDFKQCIADKQKTAPKPAKGQPKPTEAQFKAQCQGQYQTMLNQVMQFLVSAAWIEGESKDQGIKMTDADTKKNFDTQRQQSFPEDKAYQDFLKSSGYVQEDLLYRIKIQNLSNKLRAKILFGKDKVSDAQIASYYAKNKSRFSQPERRDLQIVLTKTRAKADEAKKALESGQSFKTVAEKYSIDQSSKSNGGKLPSVAKGQQEKAFDTAIFNASKGKLVGPVKTQFGYYVFDVTKITPGSTQSLAQAKDTIKQLIISQNQQKALDAFVKNFDDKWQKKTECQKGYAVQRYCKNAPKVKTTSTPTVAPAPAQPAPANGSATTTTGK